MYDDGDCGREVVPGTDYCIFHLPEKEGKLVEEFRVAFNRLLAEWGDEPLDVYDFTGFDIPIRLDFGRDFPDIIFKKAVFRKDVIFHLNFHLKSEQQYIFSEFKKVDFLEATFENTVDFSGVTFEDAAYFSGATFKDKVYFYRATFKDKVYFHGATFKVKAHFLEATFEDTADFRVTSFKIVKFMNANFLGKALFTGCTIELMGVFNFSSFEEHLIITRKNNEGSTNPYLLFLSSSFKNPNLVMISGFPLSRTSFTMTDVSNIILLPEKTSEKTLSDMLLEKENTGSNMNRNPEPEIEKSLSELTPYLSSQTVLLEYKLIRKSLENSRRFNEAAPMFIHEMTLSQNELKWTNNLFEKAAHHLYKGISEYGESINRPIILAIALITFFAFFFARCNGASTQDLNMIPQY